MKPPLPPPSSLTLSHASASSLVPSCGSLAALRLRGGPIPDRVSDGMAAFAPLQFVLCRSSQKRVAQSFNPCRQGTPAARIAAQSPRVPLELDECPRGRVDAHHKFAVTIGGGVSVAKA
uniref:Retrotransposon, putative, centromere-specific n=1 Tax=Oryza sativa subsp. japonica TaxID=39947 RepID=Q2QMH4_ORYSJ|nr:retrotransposon, putative, centromere-specific [Oryza sativa Japonica Group]